MRAVLLPIRKDPLSGRAAAWRPARPTAHPNFRKSPPADPMSVDSRHRLDSRAGRKRFDSESSLGSNAFILPSCRRFTTHHDDGARRNRPAVSQRQVALPSKCLPSPTIPVGSSRRMSNHVAMVPPAKARFKPRHMGTMTVMRANFARRCPKMSRSWLGGAGLVVPQCPQRSCSGSALRPTPAVQSNFLTRPGVAGNFRSSALSRPRKVDLK